MEEQKTESQQKSEPAPPHVHAFVTTDRCVICGKSAPRILAEQGKKIPD